MRTGLVPHRVPTIDAAAYINGAAVGALSAHRQGCHHGSHTASLLEPALDGGAVVDAAVQARDGRLLRERRE
jgi:hypothetical protein